MSNRNLGILAIVAAIMVSWAVVQSRLSNRSTVEPSGPSYLIQGLDPSEIDSIVVGHGDNAVMIQRREQQFRGQQADAADRSESTIRSPSVSTSRRGIVHQQPEEPRGSGSDREGPGRGRFLQGRWVSSDQGHISKALEGGRTPMSSWPLRTRCIWPRAAPTSAHGDRHVNQVASVGGGRQLGHGDARRSYTRSARGRRRHS